MTTRRCGGSLSAACNFDDGDCTDRFVGAGRDALAPCDRAVCSVFDAQAFTLIAWPLDSDTMLLEFINISILIIIAPAAATALLRDTVTLNLACRTCFLFDGRS